MCGRYQLAALGQALAARFGVASVQAGEVVQGLGAWQPSHIRGLHERMPVIVSREDEEGWLDPGIKERNGS
jgi:putative SOS response-associated peptidase YedK